FDKAVVIGRFQPFHNGHAAMVRKALEEAKTVYILLGSAYAYPNVLNPLTARERQTMIFSWLNANFPIEDVVRVQFEHIPDYLYNEEKWKTSVRTAIRETKGDKI
ncbi:adenylyltransferase/cytidyltransferase family protein, partial [Arthrospira platensis SPKY2]